MVMSDIKRNAISGMNGKWSGGQRERMLNALFAVAAAAMNKYFLNFNSSQS